MTLRSRAQARMCGPDQRRNLSLTGFSNMGEMTGPIAFLCNGADHLPVVSDTSIKQFMRGKSPSNLASPPNLLHTSAALGTAAPKRKKTNKLWHFCLKILKLRTRLMGLRTASSKISSPTSVPSNSEDLCCGLNCNLKQS